MYKFSSEQILKIAQMIRKFPELKPALLRILKTANLDPGSALGWDIMARQRFLAGAFGRRPMHYSGQSGLDDAREDLLAVARKMANNKHLWHLRHHRSGNRSHM